MKQTPEQAKQCKIDMLMQQNAALTAQLEQAERERDSLKARLTEARQHRDTEQQRAEQAERKRRAEHLAEARKKRWPDKANAKAEASEGSE